MSKVVWKNIVLRLSVAIKTLYRSLIYSICFKAYNPILLSLWGSQVKFTNLSFMEIWPSSYGRIPKYVLFKGLSKNADKICYGRFMNVVQFCGVLLSPCKHYYCSLVFISFVFCDLSCTNGINWKMNGNAWKVA